MSNILGLATEACKAYEQAVRVNGDKFWRHTENAPEWVIEMTHSAHDDCKILPDDWRYSFIVNALDNIVDFNGDIEEACSNLESDYETHKLTSWLASNNLRTDYVDEAVRDIGHSDGGIIGDIMRGQLEERLEVFHSVSDSLRERANQ